MNVVLEDPESIEKSLTNLENAIVNSEITTESILHAHAMLLLNEYNYDAVYVLLNDVKNKSHITFSMLIMAAFMSFRYEEATEVYNEYSQLISDDGHHSSELETEYHKIKVKMNELNINELELPKYPKGSYPQSKEENSEYPESKSFKESLKAGTLEQAFELNQLCMESDLPEVRGYANFFAGECYFITNQYLDAYIHYLSAARNIPTKALFYGYATQSLIRQGNDKAKGASLAELMTLISYKNTEKIILIRRAIDLDPHNPGWHKLLMQFIMDFYTVNNLSTSCIGNSVRQQAIKEYEHASYLLKQSPNAGQQKALDQLGTIYKFYEKPSCELPGDNSHDINATVQQSCAAEFHVPWDGSIYDAVKKIESGGTIKIASGEYRIDRMIHITKPLSIIGEGKESTVLVSGISGHYLTVCHDGYFELKNVTLKSENHSSREILAVSCGELLIEQNVFLGIGDEEIQFNGNDKRNWGDNFAISVDNKTYGTIKENLFTQNICGLVLKGASEVNVINNSFEFIDCDGVYYLGTASGTAEGNIFKKNGSSGITVNENASPKLLCNVCEENMENGISYSGSATGIAENNTCKGNKNSGIRAEMNASPRILSNICEDNLNGIDYWGYASGTIENNICNGNKEFGIVICQSASPNLLRNNCENNESSGISYLGAATGTVQENTCRGNKSLGIRVCHSADPYILNNTCEDNEHIGIFYYGSATGTAEKNVCKKNGYYGIEVTGNAFPSLISNTIEDNAADGILYDKSASGTAKGNICRRNKWSGISVDDNASPVISKNICSDNVQCGINYKAGATGTAEENICTGNIVMGIRVTQWATPKLINNQET